MEYPSWQKLEKLMEGSEAVLKSLAEKYPEMITKWIVLRRRQGRFCPMARGVLKQIVYFECKNKIFKQNLETEEWNEKWKE